VKPAADAALLDTTEMTIEAAIDRVLGMCRARPENKPRARSGSQKTLAGSEAGEVCELRLIDQGLASSAEPNCRGLGTLAGATLAD
jgi:hypothetical protein